MTEDGNGNRIDIGTVVVDGESGDQGIAEKIDYGGAEDDQVLVVFGASSSEWIPAQHLSVADDQNWMPS